MSAIDVLKPNSFVLLLHGLNRSALETELINKAGVVLTATHEMLLEVMKLRSDASAVFAPGAPVRPYRPKSDCTLLSFGMAHKLRADGYHQLSRLIAADDRSFELHVSTALHEGGSFDEAFFTISNDITDVFNGRALFLGFLSDDEISRHLREVSALVAFFEFGVRENNTTVISAMAHGCPVITNRDSLSPTWMTHNETIFDIASLKHFPTPDELARVGRNAAEVAQTYNFATLANLIESRIADE